MSYETTILIIVILASLIFTFVFLLLSRKITTLSAATESTRQDHHTIIAGQSKLENSVHLNHREYIEIASGNDKRLEKLDSNISELSATITKAIVPKIEDMYQHVEVLGQEVSLSRIVAFYKEIGVEVHEINDTTAFWGIKQNGLNVTIVFNYDKVRPFIDILTFTSVVENLSQDMLERLLVLNEQIVIGKIGFRTYQDKILLAISHGIFLSQNRLDLNVLDRTVRLLIELHLDIEKLLDEQKIVHKVILIKDFLRLELGNEEFEKEFPEADDTVAESKTGTETV